MYRVVRLDDLDLTVTVHGEELKSIDEQRLKGRLHDEISLGTLPPGTYLIAYEVE